MKVLLDENFPLGLVRILQSDGLDVEHIITLGWRGASDSRIRERLEDPNLIFLTQDEDFLFGEAAKAVVVVSRVRQPRPLKERLVVWRTAITALGEPAQPEHLFELLDDGQLLPSQRNVT